MATSQFYKDSAQPQDWKERTTWHRVIVWGKQGESCKSALRKGSPAYIDGSLRVRDYTDPQGVRRWVTEVYADRVSFFGLGKVLAEAGAAGICVQEPLPHEELAVPVG